MEARYFLYINNVEYTIDEPIGIDDFSDKLVRDLTNHGVAFNYSESELKFTDTAYFLIKNEYNLNGVNAVVFFKAEMKCQDSDNWTEFYYGQLDMTTYDDVIDRYNYIALNPTQQGVELTIKNRQDQEVDLHSLVGFDGKTLSNYPMLDKDVLLQGQNVLLTSEGTGLENDIAQSIIDGGDNPEFEDNLTGICWDGVHPYARYYMLVTPRNSTYSELSEVSINGFSSAGRISIGLFDTNSCFKLLIDKNIKINDINIKVNFDINATVDLEDLNHTPYWFKPLSAALYIETESTPTYISVPLNLGFTSMYMNIDRCVDNNSIQFQVTGIINNLTFEQLNNKRMFIAIQVESIKGNAQFADNHIKCLMSTNSYFKVTAMSYFDQTLSKSSLIHETASRIIESITNGKLSVKSDYLTRLDSNVKHQLTNVSLAGTPLTNAGNTCICNGYQIRKSKLSNGLPSYISISWKKFMESLNAIYNLGFGVEYDSINGDVLRIEDWAYFYKSDVIFEINNAPKKRSINNDELYGTFEGGYDTWETEEFNGQDAFLTGRKYRTDTNITDKTLSKTCKFIADGYAIEATRRKQLDKTTKDYKYDEKIFIVRLTNNSGSYLSERGMTNGSNLIGATSVYNSSISPARNMMRWANRFLQIIPVGKSKVVKFLSGTGNYFAKGISTNSQITAGKLIAENQNLTSSDYSGGSIIPLLKPELITLEYPVSLEEWKEIKENPLGVILVDGEKTYIKEIKYKFTSGKASFSLIPKYIQ